MVLALAALLLLAWPAGPLLAALTVLAFVLYDRLAPSSDLSGHERRLPEIANFIARTTGDDVIVLGHTHSAGSVRLGGGGRLIDTGTWAPAFVDPECTKGAFPARTFAWIRTRSGARPKAQLVAWQGGDVLPYLGRGVVVPADQADSSGAQGEQAA